MDNFPQEVNQHSHLHNQHGKMEKRNKAALIGASITAVLVVGVLIGVNSANKTQENRSDASEPVPVGIVDEQGYTVVEQTPWGYADDEISPEPVILSPAEYHELYRQVRDSFSARDYNKFKQFASVQRVWNADHPIQLVQPPVGFNKAGIIQNVDGPENFFANVIPGIQFQGLPLDDVDPTVVQRRPEVNATYLTQEINEQTKTKANVEFTTWKYIVDLKYESKPASLDKASGQVTFVYDKDHWAYHGEFWGVTPHTTPVEAGDPVPPSAVVDIALTETFNPNVEILEGQSVSWKNVKGMIYSADIDKTPWNSYYLYNDTFTKQFLVKGQHKYKLFLDRNGQTDILDGVVNVQ